MKITLLKKFLHHDMQQLAHRYAIARTDDDEKRTEAQLGAGQSDKELMQRFCHTGAGYVKRILDKHLVAVTDNADDALSDDDSWTFTFKGDTLDGDSLAEMLHWFIVKWALWQWLQMWSPADASNAKGELESLEEDLRTAVRQSGMPMKVHRPKCDACIETEITFAYEPKE